MYRNPEGPRPRDMSFRGPSQYELPVEPRRRVLKTFLGLGAAAVPTAGFCMARRSEAGQTGHGPTSLGSVNAGETEGPFFHDLRKQVVTLLNRDNIEIPHFPEQTIGDETYRPRINITPVLEAALVLAQYRFKDKGRDDLANMIENDGLRFQIVGDQNPQEPSDALTINFRREWALANLPSSGEVEGIDDWDFLVEINDMVSRALVPNASGRSRAWANGGLAGEAVIDAAAGVFTLSRLGSGRNVIGRRRLGAGLIVGAMGAAAAAGGNIGGDVVNAANRDNARGTTLGDSYRNPGLPIIRKNFFKEKIQGHLVSQ
jgi:hypothetical protein